MWRITLAGFGLLVAASLAPAQERPYFVTYSHEMEEPGNLEVEFVGVTGAPEPGKRFLGGNMELEYGVTAWWTSEFYLDGQTTVHESTIFTGYRWENRFRPLLREHWINPVIYAEFEHIGADKALREVVGHDGKADFLEPNPTANAEFAKELEFKLILGSNYRGWNFSENIVAEKNLAHEPWEFGYAWAASRPLRLAASPRPCNFCLEKWQAGAEMYGGLGDIRSLGTHDTSHYIGPTVNWSGPHGMTISFSPQFGVNDYSFPVLYRFGIAYEINQIFSRGGR